VVNTSSSLCYRPVTFRAVRARAALSE